MGFFSKRKDENNGFIINTDDESVKISGDKNLAPHAMTPDEVSNLWVFSNDEPPQQTNALDSLKKRMNVSNNVEKPKSEQVNLNPKEETKEAAPPASKPKESINVVEVVKSDTPKKISLTEKVKRYTVDEHGKDIAESKEPLYRLESVAEIIMSDGETAMKNLSEKYGIDINLTNSIKAKPTETTEKTQKNKTPINKNTTAKPTTAFEQMVSDSEKREAENLYKNIFGEDKKEETKIIDIRVPDISDIDTLQSEKPKINDVSNTATIRFTPVKDSKGNTDHITISSTTKPVELGDDYFENVSSQSTTQSLEQSEFEKFTPKTEISDIVTGKKYMHRLAKQKRSRFFGMIGSALCVLALLIFLIPPIYNSQIIAIAKTETSMFVCGAILLLSVICNVKMFADFKNLMVKRCGFDAFASLCSFSTLSLALTAALKRQNAYHMILLCAIILLVRAFSKFKEASYIASNLKQILSDKPKKAVTLIGDPATTFSMTKNKIEGDVLAAASRNSTFISDYVKYNEFAPALSGKGTFLFCFTLVFSILCGFMAFFVDNNIFVAFYSANVITCLASLPTLFFIDSLPLSSAAKKLNIRGAMIAGMHGSEKIELTNAAVVHINDIFPTGTVKMYSMRVLSDNNIDDTILRAASLTAAVNSPLEAIFNEIAGTNTSYTIPDSDTVKYEKNLGISGWVNNELLFIGNRSFMQAHGIAIPSLEVDKKILRKGYFPVYVATTDTACALVVIHYEAKPEVAKELHKLTDLGVTLLIENCDPNITEEMLCDYFDLYEDSVKIMSNAGVHMLKNATLDMEKCSAPAVYRGSHLNLVRIINCAARITRSNKLLTAMYVLFAILGMMYFVYAAFSGFMSMPQGDTILLYSLGVTVLSIIGFLIRKP